MKSWLTSDVEWSFDPWVQFGEAFIDHVFYLFIFPFCLIYWLFIFSLFNYLSFDFFSWHFFDLVIKEVIVMSDQTFVLLFFFLSNESLWIRFSKENKLKGKVVVICLCYAYSEMEWIKVTWSLNWITYFCRKWMMIIVPIVKNKQFIALLSLPQWLQVPIIRKTQNIYLEKRRILECVR